MGCYSDQWVLRWHVKEPRSDFCCSYFINKLDEDHVLTSHSCDTRWTLRWAHNQAPQTLLPWGQRFSGGGEEVLEMDGEWLQVTELFPKMVKVVYVFLTTTTKNVNVATDEINRFFIYQFYLAEELKAQAQRVTPFAVFVRDVSDKLSVHSWWVLKQEHIRGGVREVPFGVMLVSEARCSKFTEDTWRKGALRHRFTINTTFKKEPNIKSNYDWPLNYKK